MNEPLSSSEPQAVSHSLPYYTVRGTGSWVVLIHSLATQGCAWDAHAKWLAETHTVLQYDVRGHGKSAAGIGDCSLESLAADLEHLLQVLDVQQAHIVGISMGGMIAQRHAIDYPGRVRSLTLVATTGFNPPAARDAWSVLIAIARQHGMDALVDTFLSRWFTTAFRASGAPVLEEIAEWIRHTDIEGFIAAISAISTVDTLEELALLGVPSLVIAGADDPATPPEVVERMAKAIRGARYVVISNAAHWVPLEQPERFAAELASFLTLAGS